MDIFLDILLKPPQPLMGLFFNKVTWIFRSLEQKKKEKEEED